MHTGNGAKRVQNDDSSHDLWRKLDIGFTCKWRLIADVQNVYTPSSMTYYYVVSIESVRIVLLIADLNGLDVKFADVQNSYLNNKPKERVYLYTG